MINVDKFLKGQVEYKLNKSNIMDFLETVEKTTDILWQTGAKPTKFVPEFEDYVYISVVGVYKNKSVLAYTTDINFINLTGVEEYLMVNLDKFLKGEIAYVVDTNNIDELLDILEVNSDIHWLSGVKPTKYNPFDSYFMDGEEYITLGIYKTAKGGYGLGYNDKWWFESNNYKVEVF